MPRPAHDLFDDPDEAEDPEALDAPEADDDTDDGTDADDAEWLDDEFPLGDGRADVTAEVRCPYCGEANEVALDPGGGSAQEYVEDCQVCCQPWRVSVHYQADGTAEVWADCADGR